MRGLLPLALVIATLAGCSQEGAQAAPLTGAEALAVCGGKQDAAACLGSVLERDAAERGVAHAMQMLADMEREDRAVALASHELSHGIGWAAVEGGQDVRSVLLQCPPSMVSGCMHGALQAHLSALDSITQEALRGLCRSTESPESRATASQFNCFHGLGHGLDMLAGHDWSQALEWCRMLRAPNDQFLCAGGVFMENAMGEASHLAAGGHHASHVARYKADQPTYPCNAVEDPMFLLQCWTLQSNLLLAHNGNDWNATMRACDQAGHYVSTCYEGIGRDVSAAVSDNPEGVIALCSYASEAYRGDCIGGAVLAAINVHGTFTPGLLICDRAPEAQKGDCYDAVGVMNLTQPEPARARVCKDVPEEFRARCSGIFD